MTEVDVFFDRLAGAGHDPQLCKVRGSVRFDIRDGDRVRRWLLSVDHGQLRVERGDGSAGTVITTSAETAMAMVAGELNGLAAMLRGEIMVDGDLALALKIGRLFPSSPALREGAPPQARGAGG